jgi:hypothetical protein
LQRGIEGVAEERKENERSKFPHQGHSGAKRILKTDALPVAI